MEEKVKLDEIYIPSQDVVVRQIEDEMIIIPVASGIGNMEDELYTVNKNGKAIMKLLDGKNSLQDIVAELSEKYDAPPGELERDTIGFVQELFKRRLLVRV
ncbi:MAG: PqqD family protein [Methanotrichaceae archaeon]|nr:PqqD family protein [Methanotrichaceae archaeon]